MFGGQLLIHSTSTMEPNSKMTENTGENKAVIKVFWKVFHTRNFDSEEYSSTVNIPTGFCSHWPNNTIGPIDLQSSNRLNFRLGIVRRFEAMRSA